MEPIPNRAHDSRRQVLVHVYDGEDEVGTPNYSHSAYVRYTGTQFKKFHKGDIAKNIEGFGLPHSYSSDVEVPEDEITFTKPQKKDK